MAKNNVWKNLKRWLGIGAVAAGMLLPNSAKGWQDMIRILNGINNQGDARGDELAIGHRSGATEGYGTWDTDYVFPAPWAGQWAPKVITKIEGHELEIDRRPTNSVSKFEADLIAIVQDSQSISGTTKLGIYIYDTASTDYFDPKRHYPAEYRVYSNFTANGTEFVEKKNLRDLCPLANVDYEWMGPTNFVVNTTTNGDYYTGKFTLSCDWNQLVTSHSSGGTNSTPDGSEILDYGTNRAITIYADEDHYIDNYVVTRTDNIGDVSVTTNSVPGQTNRCTVALDTLMGSNSLYSTFADRKTTDGIPFSWFTRYGLTNKTASGETEDPDTDNLNNLGEYIAGTDPTNSASVFKQGIELWDTSPGQYWFTNIWQNAGSAYDPAFETNATLTNVYYSMAHPGTCLTFDGLTGRTYTAETCTELRTPAWQPVTNVTPESNGPVDIKLDYEPINKRFYRVKVGMN